MVINAARSGVKAIFCEKPIALNPKDARQMVSFCKKKNTPLIINHERRWDNYYQKALDSGAIGGKLLGAGGGGFLLLYIEKKYKQFFQLDENLKFTPNRTEKNEKIIKNDFKPI